MFRRGCLLVCKCVSTYSFCPQVKYQKREGVCHHMTPRTVENTTSSAVFLSNFEVLGNCETLSRMFDIFSQSDAARNARKKVNK